MSNFIIRNKNIFEKPHFISAAASKFLKAMNPLRLQDIQFKTVFCNSFALQSEKDSPQFLHVMRRLESYVGAGPFGPKKYWEYPWVLVNLRLGPGMSILDAGCGRSPLQYFLSDAGMQVTGVDISENAAWHGIDRGLAKRLGCKVTYRVESLHALSFPDNSFDRIACVSVLEHCRHTAPQNDLFSPQTDDDKKLQRQIVSELVRVLKPGGIASITVDFNIPRNNCMLESNIDVGNLLSIPNIKMVGNRCQEAFPGEKGFEVSHLIKNSDIYIENYLGILQTSIGVVLQKNS